MATDFTVFILTMKIDPPKFLHGSDSRLKQITAVTSQFKIIIIRERQTETIREMFVPRKYLAIRYI